MRLAALHAVFQEIADTVSASVSRDMQRDISFQPFGLTIGVDETQGAITPAFFTVERRAQVPFEENVYFSTAPVPTDDHMIILEKFEAALDR